APPDARGPLRDIKNLAAWVSGSLGDAVPPATRRHLELLRSRVARMDRLLDDLLEYSRAGRRNDQLAAIDLEATVARILPTIDLPPTFQVDVDGPICVFRAPRGPIETLLHALIDNAVKHHDRDEGRIAIRAERADEGVLLSVSDDGPGIPEEYHDRVFELFQTLLPRDRREGSGL